MSEELPKRIKIKVIEAQGLSSLIEWQVKGMPYRGYVPSEQIDGDKCSFSALAYALPVGPDPMAIDLRKFTKQLRLRDVWTLEDVQKKRGAVIRSLLEAMEVK